MKTIGIICACDTELEPFLPYLKQMQVSEAAMHKFYSGFLFGQPAVCVQCGVCKVNAALTAQLLIDHYHVELMINSGTAGGMDSEVHIFDTVISEKIAHHDVSADILTEGFPYMKTEFFPAGEELLEAAKKAAKKAAQRVADAAHGIGCNAAGNGDSNAAHGTAVDPAGGILNTIDFHSGKIHFGTMVSGEAFIDDEGREKINRRFAPLTVDMETAGIAHACYINGVPFLSVRTVTDTEAERGLSVYSDNSERAEKTAAQFVIAIIRELSHMENA